MHFQAVTPQPRLQDCRNISAGEVGSPRGQKMESEARPKPHQSPHKKLENPEKSELPFTAEDIFHYLYGYSQMQLVDPQLLQRERHRVLNAKYDKEKAGSSWCDICNEKHEGECPMHGPLHSLRKLVNGQNPFEYPGVLKFPDEVALCTTSIPSVGSYGVCARKRIPAGTWIGPYEGRLVRPDEICKETETEFMWEIFHDGQVSHYLDGKDEQNSSWMRFIRCARHKKEQNMVVFQYHGCVYYRTIKDVLPGHELLVWYDSRYSQFMGIPVTLSDSNGREPAHSTHGLPVPVSQTSGKGMHPPRDLVVQEKQANVMRTETAAEEPPAKRGRPSEYAQSASPPENGSALQKGLNSDLSIKSLLADRKDILNGAAAMSAAKSKQDKAISIEIERTYRPVGRGRPPNARRGLHGAGMSLSSKLDAADDFTWRCNQCFKAFPNREQLELHHCNSTSPKSYPCNHCNLSFPHPGELRAHMEVHINERPFRCGYCACSFTSAASLNQHVRVHLETNLIAKPITRHEVKGQEYRFIS